MTKFFIGLCIALLVGVWGYSYHCQRTLPEGEYFHSLDGKQYPRNFVYEFTSIDKKIHVEHIGEDYWRIDADIDHSEEAFSCRVSAPNIYVVVRAITKITGETQEGKRINHYLERKFDGTGDASW